MGLFDKLFGKKNENNNLQANISDEQFRGYVTPQRDGISNTNNELSDSQSSNARIANSENNATPFARQQTEPYVSTMCHVVNAAITDQMKKHFIAIDIETTGLSPSKDRIIELGAVEFIDGREVRRFSTLINVGISIPATATQVNHITNDMIRDAPSEQIVYPSFINFLGDAVKGKVFLCAHNASFDFGFLENTLRRLGIKVVLHYVDTLSLCRKSIKGLPNYKQSTIEHHFGFKNAAAHRAVSDAEMCGKILLKALECEECSIAIQREIIEKSKPSPDELEVCAIIQKILMESRFDTGLLSFRKSSSTVDGMCLYPFISFKFARKGRYIILPAAIANLSNYVTEACTNAEGGSENRRVYFKSPFEIEQFSECIVKSYLNAYESAKHYISQSKRTATEADSYKAECFRFESDELTAILHQICTKDYSEISIPEVEIEIKREDIIIHPINNRVPLSEIKNRNNDDRGFDQGFSYYEHGESLRKDGKLEEAIHLFDQARYYGYNAPALYESYAMVFHKLKDYENEIDILDEGIERNCTQGFNISRLETRRASAVKALIKLNEAKLATKEKEEAKQCKLGNQHTQRQSDRASKASGRAIIQMDDDGNVIAEYPTVTEAASAVGISMKSIRDAAKGIQRHAAGFCWRYKDDNN